MRLLGWTLIQNDWCSLKGGEFGYKDRHTQRKDDVKIEGWQPTTSQGVPETTRSWERGLEQVLRQSLQGKLNLLMPWAQIWSLQKCKTVYDCCLSLPARSIHKSPWKLTHWPLLHFPSQLLSWQVHIRPPKGRLCIWISCCETLLSRPKSKMAVYKFVIILPYYFLVWWIAHEKTDLEH